MFIPRSKEFVSPTLAEILLSGVLHDDPKHPVIFEGWGYKGDTPMHHFSQMTKGTFIAFKKGIVFLTTGETRFSVSNILEHAIRHTGGDFGIVGSTVVSLGLLPTQLHQFKERLGKGLEHPASFVVPHLEIINAVLVKKDILKSYGVLIRETPEGKEEFVLHQVLGTEILAIPNDQRPSGDRGFFEKIF
jgi:hypothetical protein